MCPSRCREREEERVVRQARSWAAEDAREEAPGAGRRRGYSVYPGDSVRGLQRREPNCRGNYAHGGKVHRGLRAAV